MLGILKKSSKQEIDLQPFPIFETMRSVFYFWLGISSSLKSFQRKFIALDHFDKKLRVTWKNFSLAEWELCVLLWARLKQYVYES